MKRTCLAMMLLPVLLGGFSVVARAQDDPPLTIGVITPAAGPARSLGQQIAVGAEIAVEELTSTKVELEFATADPTDRRALGTAYQELLDRNVNAIIGGVTSTDAEFLRSVPENSPPTILLADNANSATLPPHVLQLGLTREALYREGLQQWLQMCGIERPSVIYDESRRLTHRYGADFTQAVMQEQGLAYDPISYFGTRSTSYDRQMEEVTGADPDGIVVSGLPWDTANLVHELSESGEMAAIYLAPPAAVPGQFVDVAAETLMPMYYGIEFWPAADDEEAEAFMAEVRDRLGWLPNSPPSIPAIEAYDAVQVLHEVWRTGNWVPEQPWEDISTVEGITGELTLRQDANTIAGPVRVLPVFEPQDDAQRQRWQAACLGGVR